MQLAILRLLCALSMAHEQCGNRACMPATQYCNSWAQHNHPENPYTRRSGPRWGAASYMWPSICRTGNLPRCGPFWQLSGQKIVLVAPFGNPDTVSDKQSGSVCTNCFRDFNRGPWSHLAEQNALKCAMHLSGRPLSTRCKYNGPSASR
jgi:hypothetical protein